MSAAPHPCRRRRSDRRCSDGGERVFREDRGAFDLERHKIRFFIRSTSYRRSHTLVEVASNDCTSVTVRSRGAGRVKLLRQRQ